MAMEYQRCLSSERDICDLLVFPAASRPNMSRRISFDPKILPIILETWPPMVGSYAYGVCRGRWRRRCGLVIGSWGRFD